MKHRGFHGRAGFGQRPALIVVDVNPASPTRRRRSCAISTASVDGDRPRCSRRRAAAGCPSSITTVAYDEADKRTAAAFIDKIPALLTLEAGSRWSRSTADRAAPGRAGAEQAVRVGVLRHAAREHARRARAATAVIVTGASTSGCVRATVVDALQHGYRVVVPREAVGDRNPARPRGEALRHRREVRRRRARRRRRRPPGGDGSAAHARREDPARPRRRRRRRARATS